LSFAWHRILPFVYPAASQLVVNNKGTAA
jgi:hypothetical protein